MSDGLISGPSDLNKCHQYNLKQLFKQVFGKLVAEVISNLFWLLWKKNSIIPAGSAWNYIQ